MGLGPFYLIKPSSKINVLDLLSEYGMLACKPVKTPLMSKLIISNEASEKDLVLDNMTDYQKLMAYFQDIEISQKLSRFGHSYYQDLCKKQNTLSKSSTEVEYRALASVTSEVIWILKILKDLNVENLLPVSLHCDSNSAIKIAANPVFHERTKHLQKDLHFVREDSKGVIKTVKVAWGSRCQENNRWRVDCVILGFPSMGQAAIKAGQN
ncbi:ribonuclease H-like domain-containing protein [Tanacetum coccineum]